MAPAPRGDTGKGPASRDGVGWRAGLRAPEGGRLGALPSGLGDSPVPHCPLPRDLWSPGRFPPGLLLVLGVEEEWGSARAAPGLTTSRCGNPRLFGGTCPPKPTELLGIPKRIRLPGAPLSGFLAPQNMRFLIPARKRPFALPSAHQEVIPQGPGPFFLASLLGGFLQLRSSRSTLTPFPVPRLSPQASVLAQI